VNLTGSDLGGGAPSSTLRNAALKQELGRDPVELLAELRSAWGLPPTGPLRVVGRLWCKELANGRELWFLDDIEHPENGAGLLYPTLPGTIASNDAKSAAAFVPPGPSRKVVSRRAISNGEQWAIAELELSPLAERQKQSNPWLLNVRSGTLRPLSELPVEWEIEPPRDCRRP